MKTRYTWGLSLSAGAARSRLHVAFGTRVIGLGRCPD